MTFLLQRGHQAVFQCQEIQSNVPWIWFHLAPCLTLTATSLTPLHGLILCCVQQRQQTSHNTNKEIPYKFKKDCYKLLDIDPKHPIRLQKTLLEEKLLDISRRNFIRALISLTKYMAAVFWRMKLTAASMTFTYLSEVNSDAISLTPSVSRGCARHWQICTDICLTSHQNEKMNLEGKHSWVDI